VPVLAADARGLEAAERRRRVADAPRVDVDRPGAQQAGQAVGVGDVARPDAGGEPVLGVVGALGDLLERVVGLRDENGAEDLLADDLGRVIGRGEERRLDEVAALAETAFESAERIRNGAEPAGGDRPSGRGRHRRFGGAGAFGDGAWNTSVQVVASTIPTHDPGRKRSGAF